MTRYRHYGDTNYLRTFLAFFGVAFFLATFLLIAHGILDTMYEQPPQTQEPSDLTEVITHTIKNANDIAEIQRRLDILEQGEKP